MKRTKKIISMLLAILIVMGMIPMATVSAFAQDAYGAEAIDDDAYGVDADIIWAETGRVITGSRSTQQLGTHAYLKGVLNLSDGTTLSLDKIFNYEWISDSESISISTNGKIVCMKSGVANITLNITYEGEIFTATTTIIVNGTMSFGHIGAISVSGISAPFAGLPLDWEGTVQHNGCTLQTDFDTNYIPTGISWRYANGNTIPYGEVIAQKDKSYTLTLFLETKPGYVFSDNVQVLLGNKLSDKVFTFSGYDKKNYIAADFVFSLNYDLNLTNAVAKNENGDVITSAPAGEKVYVTAVPSAMGQQFVDFYVTEPDALDFVYTGAGEGYFTMPEGNVTIDASFTLLDLNYIYTGLDRPVADNEIDYTPDNIEDVGSFDRFYLGYSFLAPDGIENYNGILWEDTTTGETLAPGDSFVDGHTYRLTVYISVADGYYFSYPEANVYAGISPYKSTIGGYDSSKHIMVVYDGIVPVGRKAITTTNCIAYNEAGEIVTEAFAGEEIKLIATAPVYVGQPFLGFNVYADKYVELTTDFDVAYFTMPDCDVSVGAEYGAYELTRVDVSIDAPIIGTALDFTPETRDFFSNSWSDDDIIYPYTFASFTGTDFEVVGGVMWFDNTYGLDYPMSEGNVFYEGSVYNLCIYIKAEPGFSLDNLSYAYIENYGSAEILDAYGEYKLLRIKNVTPKREYSVTANGGIVYNDLAEVTTAIEGTFLRLVLNQDADDMRTFSHWELSDGTIVYDREYYFDMPAEDLEFTAVYNDIPVSDCNFNLDFFYVGNDGYNLSITENIEGASIAHGITSDVYGNPLDYVLYGINVDTYFNAVHQKISSGYEYAIDVEITPDDYYCIDEDILLENATITVNGETYGAVKCTLTNTGAILSFNIGTPASVIYSPVWVNGGTAYWNGRAVSEAPAGAVIYLEPDFDSLMVGQQFGSWAVDFGGVTVQADEYGSNYFVMSDEAVCVTAKAKGAIYNIYISDIDIPVAGESPDYLATVYPEDGYDIILRSDYGWINGVSWWESIDQYSSEKLDPETAVFEEGKTYHVNFCIEALEEYWFPVNEEGAPTVQAFVNGTYASVAMYGDDGSRTVSVSIEFTVPKAYSITVEGGNAYDPRGNASGAPTESDGDPIYSAYPGTYVKVVADIPAGYEFSHWEIVEGAFKIDEDSLKSSTFRFDMPDSDVVLRAHFTLHEEHEWDENNNCICGAKGYNVIFSWAPGEQIFGYTVIENGYASEPAEPAQDGVVFVGWYTVDGEKFDFDTPITEDIELIATFEPANDILLGDLNGDGAVNAMDTNLLKRVLAGVLTLGDETMAYADINSDGQINGLDSNLLSRIVSGAN